MDYKMRQHKQNLPCKHLYFIINRVCNNLGYENLTTISENYIQVKERIEKRIKDVLENKSKNKDINLIDKSNDKNKILLDICKDEEYCSICYDDFDYEHINEQTIKICLSQCKKPFHEDCIRMWLARHNTCPMCRSNLTKNKNEVDIHNDPFCHLTQDTIKM